MKPSLSIKNSDNVTTILNITVSEMQGAQEDEVIKLKRNMLFKNKKKYLKLKGSMVSE